MFDFPTLILFMTAAALLLISPGPAVLYVVARSIDQGRLAGLVSVLGISIGSFVHTAAAALGISTLLASSALAFAIVKYLGAAYLVYLGLRTLLTPVQTDVTVEATPSRLSNVFWQGVIVNVLNPKSALFFLAFLPQFVNPARGSATLQILMLGVIFALMALVSDGLYAITAGTVGPWLRNNLRYLHMQRYLAGGVYIALGVATAVSGSGRQT